MRSEDAAQRVLDLAVEWHEARATFLRDKSYGTKARNDKGLAWTRVELRLIDAVTAYRKKSESHAA